MGFLFSCRLSSRRPRAESDLAMIEASLRNCSIRRRGAAAASHHHPSLDLDPATAAITVDLSSEVPPLPHQWHRFLDTQTGEIYYVNLADGTKTTQDPRKPQISAAASVDVLSDEDSNSVLVNEEDDDDLSSDGSYGGDSDDDEADGEHIEDEGYYYSSSSTSSYSGASTITAGASEASCSSSSLWAAAPGHGQRGRRRGSEPVLVLGGCRLCHSYFMVEKTASECPNCGGRLVHFGG